MNNEVIKKLQIKNGKLQIQVERLKLDKEEYYLDYLNLQQRIEKAIEEIKELRHWVVNNKHNENTKEHYLVVDYGMLLGKINSLSILRGKDNDK